MAFQNKLKDYQAKRRNKNKKMDKPIKTLNSIFNFKAKKYVKFFSVIVSE